MRSVIIKATDGYAIETETEFLALLDRLLDVLDRINKLNNSYADVLSTKQLDQLSRYLNSYRVYIDLACNGEILWDDDTSDAYEVDLFILYDKSKYGIGVPSALANRIKQWRKLASTLKTKIDKASYSINPRLRD